MRNIRRYGRKKIILPICLAVILAVLSVWLLFQYKRDTTMFVEIESPEELYTLSNEILYFGRDDCLDCMAAEKILEPRLKENHKKILYFNTNTWREHDRYQDILEDFQIKEVPVLVKVSDGQYANNLQLFDKEGRMDIGLVMDYLDLPPS